MPIYSKSKEGNSGYSGLNPIVSGDEVLPPLMGDAWTLDGDVQYNGEVVTYTNGEDEWGDVYVESSEFLSDLTPGIVYRFQWTLQNVNIDEGIVAELEDSGYELLSPLTIINGTSSVIFTMTENNELFDIYINDSVGGLEGTFDIIGVSLKKYEAAPAGESGFRGYDSELPPKGGAISPAVAGTLLTKFNLLLSELKTTGWMEEDS